MAKWFFKVTFCEKFLEHIWHLNRLCPPHSNFRWLFKLVFNLYTRLHDTVGQLKYPKVPEKKKNILILAVGMLLYHFINNILVSYTN